MFEVTVYCPLITGVRGFRRAPQESQATPAYLGAAAENSIGDRLACSLVGTSQLICREFWPTQAKLIAAPPHRRKAAGAYQWQTGEDGCWGCMLKRG